MLDYIRNTAPQKLITNENAMVVDAICRKPWSKGKGGKQGKNGDSKGKEPGKETEYKGCKESSRAAVVHARVIASIVVGLTIGPATARIVPHPPSGSIIWRSRDKSNLGSNKIGLSGQASTKVTTGRLASGMLAMTKIRARGPLATQTRER